MSVRLLPGEWPKYLAKRLRFTFDPVTGQEIPERMVHYLSKLERVDLVQTPSEPHASGN